VLGYAEDQFERPSVRMGMAAWSVARLLHPGLREK
jgi:hypothetical protein